MAKEIFGCGCCGGSLGGLFAVRGARSGSFRATPGSVSRRAFVAGATAAAGFAAAFPAASIAQEPTTSVFTGGTILTVDEDFSEVEAIAIRGNLIIAAGAVADVRAVAGERATMIDLGGKAMLPGFVDPHTHVVVGAMVDSIMDYVGVARFATTREVLDHLSAAVAVASTAADSSTISGRFIRIPGREADPRPTAIFAHNDALALGAIEAMRSRGLRYPDDFAIAGFNNTQISRVLALPLTTIQYPIEQVSRHAGELVRRLIENPAADVESKTFAPSLIVRAST